VKEGVQRGGAREVRLYLDYCAPPSS